MARAYAQAVVAARKDSRLTPAERERSADDYTAQAVHLLDRVRAAEPNLPLGMPFNFACVFALAGRAEKAIAVLNQFRRDGFFDKAENLKMLRTDHDLDSLRQRDDFIKFVNDLTKPPDQK